MARDDPTGIGEDFMQMAEELFTAEGRSMEDALRKPNERSAEQRAENVRRVGEILKRTREEMQLSIEEVSSRSRVDAEVIAALEAGRETNPYVWEMEAIPVALDTNLTAVLIEAQGSQN